MREKSDINGSATESHLPGRTDLEDKSTKNRGTEDEGTGDAATDDIRYLLWLNSVPGIGPVTERTLLKNFQTAEAVYEAGSKELTTMQGLQKRQMRSILEHRSFDTANRILDACRKEHIEIITLSDPDFPEGARNLSDLPTILFFKGNLDELQNHFPVAIAGPRRCSRADRELAIKLAENHSRENHAILSGMAKGIDAYAHTACLKQGGYTVAILANGLDLCYPSEHRLLMQRIGEQGLLLSEYPPGTEPKAGLFPRRNRIIAAIAQEIVIVGAGERSGARITEEFGRRYGKIIHSVHGDENR